MTSGKRNWYYQVGDQLHGPLFHLDVREKAAAGEIEPGTLIRSGNQEWRRADHVYFLSEFFPPVERSEDCWEENSRSEFFEEEIQQCKGNLILLVVSCLLLPVAVLLGPIAILIVAAGIIKSIFWLWYDGWEATRESAKITWAELRHRLSNHHGSEK